MALLQVRHSVKYTTLFVKSLCTALRCRYALGDKQLHGSVPRLYMELPKPRLPGNSTKILNGESSFFKSERARDIGATFVHYGSGSDSYVFFGAVNRSDYGSAQINVPKPFLASGHSTYFNTPGSQWARMDKYLDLDTHGSHYIVYRAKATSDILNGLFKSARFYSTTTRPTLTTTTTKTTTATTTNAEDCQIKKPKIIISKKDRLRITAVQLGIGILVTYFVVSLLSFCILYAFIIRGVDMKAFVNHLYTFPEEKLNSIFDENSEVWLAFKINNLIFHLRITFTLFTTFVILKYLRRKKIVKTPKYILRSLENRSTSK